MGREMEEAFGLGSRFVFNDQAVPLDTQWQQVQALYEQICRSEPDGLDADSLAAPIVATWNSCRTSTQLSAEFPRGASLRDIDESPLAVMFWFIAQGMYPPPEIVLGLHATWEGYLYCAGAVDLERAFNGPPIKKAGNLAQRSDYRKKLLWMFKEVERLEASGMSREDAAEDVSVQLGGTPTSDSILRTMKKYRVVSVVPDQNGP